jgi:phosphoserine phosphatase RsbU/P
LKIYLNTPEIPELMTELDNHPSKTVENIEWVNDTSQADIRIYDHSLWRDAKGLETDILVSGMNDEFNILKLLAEKPCYNLIGKNDNYVREINQVIRTVKDKNNWNSSLFFGEYINSYNFSFNSSCEVKKELNNILDNINYEKNFKSSVDIVRLLSNELLMNAFYHNKSATADRTSNVLLEKPVIFELGLNNQGILIKVTDTNGGIQFEKLLDSLIRGFKEKTPRKKEGESAGGAGLGLYFIFKMANQTILNVTKDKGTEIICVVDANKRYKEYMARVSSLLFFRSIK